MEFLKIPLPAVQHRDPRLGQAHSLLEITGDALGELVAEARLQGVDLAWTIDPCLPPYVSVMRVDLFSIISVLIRRALQLVRSAPLHLTVAQSHADQVELQLEDSGESTAALAPRDWQQLCYWVEELGGTMSRAAEGLQWRISLPLDLMSAARIKLNHAASGLRLLIACADTDSRSRVLGLLEAGDHTLVECRSAAEARTVVRRRRFDLLLLDRDLPDGSGLELAEELRALTPSRQAMAIMMVGEPEPVPGYDWIRFWLHKPPRAAEFGELLQALAASGRTGVSGRRHAVDADAETAREQ